MAAPRLKVGGFDFSPYLRTQPDESTPMDPAAPGYFRPQFSGTPALAEGASWVADAVDNRTMPFPLYFTAENRTQVKALIEEANEVLVKGAQVEFCSDPDVESSSFFDLERGVVNEEFNFYHLVNNVAGAVLMLTVRPYANSATHRLVASIPAATSAVVKFAATGISGDAYSLANLEVRVGSAVASAGRVIAWGVHPHPSHNPFHQARLLDGQASTSIISSPTAIGSFYAAVPVSPTGASGVSYKVFLDPVDAHIGRHRVIAIARSGLTGGIPLYAEDRFGAILGATAIATQTDQTKWQVVDLGTVNVPARASGQDSIPTQYVNIYGGGASGYGINASPAFQVNGILFLPLDYSAGIMRTKGAAGPLYADTFTRLSNSEFLAQDPLAEIGGVSWNEIGGLYTRFPGQVSAITPENSKGGTNGNASAIAALASGVLKSNVAAAVTLKTQAGTPAGMASARAQIWAKAITNASQVVSGISAQFAWGPSQFVALWSASSNGATVLKASAGIASSLASGVYLGQDHTLVLKVVNSRADVWLATGALGPSPVLSASSAEFGAPGWPVLAAAQASNSGIATYIGLSQFYVFDLTNGASDIAPREFFRFESHPEGRVYQGSASAFTADRLAEYRGQFPKLPPVPTAATGPARVVVLQGEIDNIQGQDGPDIALSVLERFRFLR